MLQKLRRQEELLRRQTELQREMEEKRKLENEQRLAEKRGGREPRYPAITVADKRGSSPPIPTMRNNTDRPTAEPAVQDGSAATSDVIEQLSNMRKGLERRRTEFADLQPDGGDQGGVWQGLEE